MLSLRFLTALTLLCFAALHEPVEAQSLRGSIELQNRQARLHGYTFLRTPADVQRFVERGYLVPVRPNADFRLKEVSFPYARKEVGDFLTLLASRYRKACGEQLVVTSLTRAQTRQPRNASRRSVHPTGMAVDLRRSWSLRCRRWLEQTLLDLEAGGVLDAAYERRPPHYHLALFPRAYRERGEGILTTERRDVYRVVRGDTLWRIADRHQTSVEAVKHYNRLRSSRIYPGQLLRLPAGRR